MCSDEIEGSNPSYPTKNIKIREIKMKIQEISYNGEIKCITKVTYPVEVVNAMKKGGYKVKEYELEEKEGKNPSKKTKK